MRQLTFLWIGAVAFTCSAASAAEPPRGNLLELHSCQVYAGGCVVSSEATLGGRHLLRAWQFAGGSFAGQDLRGLLLAVLESSPENLAAPGSKSGDAVVYLPQSASPAQRQALVAWLKSSQPDFHPATLHTRIAPLRFTQTDAGSSFSAGEFVAVKTEPLQRCETFTCGEALWYQPRSATSLFTVAVDRSSEITEPLLKLNWKDNDKRNVFLARFGEPVAAKTLYVSLEELCGAAGASF